ncbi:hypothetical protein GCM10011519_06360 [Marmoricola endophyticus]|uniref:Cellulose synthase n=1 Tax=Marmoricola endophyticus TaxID=2040280 RepID=A0A917BBJ9_9ACTN|nr:hypothetical protein [Marmoricola endophyticus]GGF35592.1 hypothetical protein GCM10011519_06360 [Marmoricola endophyticus]
MDTVETSSRAAIALVVTLVLLGATWLAWRRSGPASALRWFGVALLPVAAWLTGTLGLISEVAGDVSRYVARLVFSPVVWTGVVVLVVAVVLIGLGTTLRNRGIGVRGRAPGVPARPDRAASAPAAREQKAVPASRDDGGLDDDVADILKKHGIS